MGGLFGGSPAPPPPPEPDPELKAAQDRQEARLAEEERQKRAEIAARRRARQIGGQRMLLSPERENPQMGIDTTLGAG
jgi:hypothetical protein